MGDSYSESEQSDQSESEQLTPKVKTKSGKAKAQKKKKAPTKKLKKNQQPQSDTQVLQITTSRGVIEHARPLFLKNWDGVSNSFQLTEYDLRNLSPMMSIYWQYKSQNMNVVTFVQIGSIEWYVYENDAILIHEVFGKDLRKFSKFLMVHFWSSEIALIKAELYKQKIPMHFMSEVEDWNYKRKNGIIRRQVTQIVNPAVHLQFQPEEAEPSQRFLVSIYAKRNKFGVVVIDCQTNKYYLQEVKEDDLRRVLNKFKPVEVVLAKGNLKEEKKLIKQVCNPYIVEILHDTRSLDQIVQSMKQINGSKVFHTLSQLAKDHNEPQQKFQYYSCLMALDLSCSYFSKLGVSLKIFPNAVINFVSFSQLNLRPVFDAQVYENLEVFQVKEEEGGFGRKGTLYAYLNRCKTQSGCRKLRQWINTPLTDKNQIKRRQQAIQDIINNPIIMKKLHQDLGSLSDIETKVANIYHWVVQKQENLNIRKDKDYNQNNNPLIVKIKQIRELLLQIIKVNQFMEKVQSLHPHFKSKYLKQITSRTKKNTQTDNTYFGKISTQNSIVGIPEECKDACTDILDRIQYDEQAGTMKPKKGIIPEYDTEAVVIVELYKQLRQELDKWKKKLDCNKMNFVSVRQRNEIEIPKGIIKDKVKGLHFSSSTSKVQRYTTPQSESVTAEIIEHEEMIDNTMIPFLNKLIKDFSSSKFIWDQLCQTISELDVLCGLANVSQQMQISCVPEFVDQGLQYTDGIHIGLYQMNKKIVRNSVKFGEGETIMLITGPNMGGKSTILRQTCLLAIIAQIGCYVPAKEYKAKVFDQIFCRIGASDRIVEGKSTFFVELEETKHILSKATQDSLVVIDELGRGTSTFDGISIAVGVLRELIQEIGCLTLFSTHYSIVADEFTTCKQVRNKTVTYQIDHNRLKFSYQLADGISERSFAENVARMVGIPDSILERAQEKSEMITKQSQTLRHLQEVTKRFSDLLISLKVV